MAGQCHLSATLSGSDLDDLSRFENRLMLDDDSFALRVLHEGRAKIHWSAELQHNYDSYVAFLKALQQRGMLNSKFACRENVGVFVVSKKSGRLRLIIDCRRLNQRLKRPPRTPLVSSVAFGEVTCDPGSPPVLFWP